MGQTSHTAAIAGGKLKYWHLTYRYPSSHVLLNLQHFHTSSTISDTSVTGVSSSLHTLSFNTHTAHPALNIFDT
eukprot:12318397-Karenia_brevis.AAC.1